MFFSIAIVLYALPIICITVVTSKRHSKDDIGNFMASKGRIGTL